MMAVEITASGRMIFQSAKLVPTVPASTRTEVALEIFRFRQGGDDGMIRRLGVTRQLPHRTLCVDAGFDDHLAEFRRVDVVRTAERGEQTRPPTGASARGGGSLCSRASRRRACSFDFRERRRVEDDQVVLRAAPFLGGQQVEHVRLAPFDAA